jgi:hypothetical protein
MDQQHSQNRISASSEAYITIQAGPDQIEQLAALGVLNDAQVEAGRKAGGLAVRVPAEAVADFKRNQTESSGMPDLIILSATQNEPVARFVTEKIGMGDETAEIERLARRIDEAGLNTAARLFVASNRPLSFFASQFLLLVQPVSRLTLGTKDPTGRYSRLLENRANLDHLLACLDDLENERRAAKAARRSQEANSKKKERA